MKSDNFGALILTGNYPSEWVTPDFADAVQKSAAFTVLIDTLPNRLKSIADVVLPGATWAEKAGTFENANGRLQAFEQAVPVAELAKPEGQIALDLIAELNTGSASAAERFNAATIRGRMAQHTSLAAEMAAVHMPSLEAKQEADMEVVEL